MSLSVLHLANCYAINPLYDLLINELDKFGIDQAVYCPVRVRAQKRRQLEESRHITKIVPEILMPYDRVFYFNKINRIYENLTHAHDCQQIGLIHAHTLYSDGGVARRLSLTLSKPYIVAVRNTDLNAFQRYRPDLRRQRDRILRDASHVVVISPAYGKRLLGLLQSGIRDVVAAKLRIVPNGVNPFWLKDGGADVAYGDKDKDQDVRVLYVGRLSQEKNLPRLIEAVKLIRRNMRIRLTIIGGGGDDEKRIKLLINRPEYEFVEYIDHVSNLIELRSVYRRHDIFAMPSLHETFGLVYIEALSQGLPIIHSCGEGVDGYFAPGTVAEPVDPLSVHDIARGISTLLGRQKDVAEKCRSAAKEFRWDRVAQTYMALYSEAKNSSQSLGPKN